MKTELMHLCRLFKSIENTRLIMKTIVIGQLLNKRGIYDNLV
ncbi:hypothetical protein BTN50_0738 [Candidatus Enterovibrio altilux]|uniref:Uncharacterized protein n=1 Tax=Candidatus Enterovibrio altilux TaxID=1927128 RepID=A0A291B8D3_9GAMM|nr:hypothetical protein BTN50_0738 [Candidatus Enterovibrio luxaltus]